jgi:hypothetical protein
MNVQRTSTAVLSLAMAIIGLVLLVQALAGGGAAVRLVLGVLFLAAGSGRLYLLARGGPRA